jgi:hypothetical protein
VILRHLEQNTVLIAMVQKLRIDTGAGSRARQP